MLILDDLLLAPFKGLFWVFRKIDQAAREELENRKQRTTAELSELYMMLDTGKITEQQFDAREKVLLDQLDQIKRQQQRQTAPLRPQGQEQPRHESAARRGDSRRPEARE